jgi:hypothetical protein
LSRAWEPGAEATSIGSILAALNSLSIGTGDVSGLIAFLSLHDVELHLFAITHTAEVLARVVLHNSRLMHEHILLGVVSVNEAISVLHVKPFNGTSYFGCDYFFLNLLLLLFNFLFPCRFGLGHGS